MVAGRRFGRGVDASRHRGGCGAQENAVQYRMDGRAFLFNDRLLLAGRRNHPSGRDTYADLKVLAFAPLQVRASLEACDAQPRARTPHCLSRAAHRRLLLRDRT